MTEGRIQDEIMLALNGPDVVVFRNNVGKAELNGRWVAFGVGGPGGSDLVCVVCGCAVFIEVKTPIGKLRPDQVRFRNLVQAKGAEFVVLRSADDARAWLANFRARQS